MPNDVGVLSQLIKHLSMDERDPLTPLIDEYLIKRDLSPNRLEEYVVPLIPRARPGGRLSPSAIGGCQRMALFKFLALQGDRKAHPDTELTFDDGNWIHHKWDARLLDMERVLGKKRFKVVKIEGKITIPSLYIAGSYDVVVRINGKLYVIDYKSIHSHGFGYIYREHKPKEPHIKQLVTYCVAKGIRRGMLLYDDKGISSNYLVFLFEFNDKDWERVQRWCRKVLKNLEEETIPKRSADCDHGNYLFESCPFARYCWSEDFESNPERLRRLAFRNFKGIDEAWKRGLKSWK